MEIPIKLLVDPATGRSAQTEFFNLTKRHQCFSGGYGNGKSYAASLKALTLLLSFPKYRVAICRYSATDLKRSTMSTFFKVCPPEAYDSNRGGNRADSLNYTKLINGSEIFWMNLQDANEQTVRGLEINSVVIDQAEEITENMYNHLSARVGRWDRAEVPAAVLNSVPHWPRHSETGDPIVPAYSMILVNPDTELHWVYRRFHPDSFEWLENFKDDYEMIEASSTENPTLDKATLKDMMSNDPVWVRRFVYGKWGIPGGSIHVVSEDSVLEPGKTISLEFIDTLRRSAMLYRVLDHGDASPTACAWVASYKDHFFFLREYYKPGALISEHRTNIDGLSRFADGTRESYRANWADPSIFKKDSQKNGGFWSVADEYLDPRIEQTAPAIAWSPADNNEFATRNRINEYLRPNPGVRHPITGIDPAPRIYFIKRNEFYPEGCNHLITQTKSQKRELLETINGKPIYGDDRDEGIPDHAYDLVRYFCAMHPYYSKRTRIAARKGSFHAARKSLLALKRSGNLEEFYGHRIDLGRY